MYNIIYEGTEIRCPNPKCNVILAIAIEDVIFNSKIIAELYEPVVDPNFGHPDKPFTCIKCSTPYVRINGDFKIYTQFGWVGSRE